MSKGKTTIMPFRTTGKTHTFFFFNSCLLFSAFHIHENATRFFLVKLHFRIMFDF